MRLHVFMVVAFLEALLAAGTARAQRSPDAGPELAVRAGLALPFGDIQGGMNASSLDQYASSALPLVLEAGYRIDSSLFFGARFQYAFPQLKNPNGGCGGNVSCDGSDVTLGLEALYRFMPERTFAPWVGLGLGYEWLSFDANAPNVGGGFTAKGFQGLVQGGGDYRVNEKLVLGPFLEAALGRFDSAETRLRLGNGTTTNTADIANTALHTWVTLGVRGAFGF